MAKIPQLFDFWTINHFSVGKLCFCAISFLLHWHFCLHSCVCIFVTGFFSSSKRNIFHFHLLLWNNNRKKNGASALVWREFNQYYIRSKPKNQNSVREEIKRLKLMRKTFHVVKVSVESSAEENSPPDGQKIVIKNSKLNFVSQKLFIFSRPETI